MAVKDLKFKINDTAERLFKKRNNPELNTYYNICTNIYGCSSEDFITKNLHSKVAVLFHKMDALDPVETKANNVASRSANRKSFLEGKTKFLRNYTLLGVGIPKRHVVETRTPNQLPSQGITEMGDVINYAAFGC